jgi:hypothetical protein
VTDVDEFAVRNFESLIKKQYKGSADCLWPRVCVRATYRLKVSVQGEVKHEVTK